MQALITLLITAWALLWVLMVMGAGPLLIEYTLCWTLIGNLVYLMIRSAHREGFLYRGLVM